MAAVRRESIAFTVTVGVIAAICAVPMALVIYLSGAPSTVVLATVLAAVPVAPLVAAYLWLDRYEPEPRSLLALGLAWGGFVATAVALVIGGIGQWFVPVSQHQSLTVVSPLIEEASKGAFLILLLWWRRSELDGVLDGIVYAGMVGIGFAFVENILYLAAAYNGTDGLGPGGTDAITATFVLRCLFSPFAHPLFTAFIGIGVGIAVGSRSRLVQVAAPLAGYLFAVVAHGTWNTATLHGLGGAITVYVVVMIPALLLLMAFALWARNSEQKILYAALSDAARRGLFPPEDIAWLVDLRARRVARQHARDHGGAAGLRAMKAYQAAAIELGFLHHRYLRGTAPRDFSDRGQDFVNQLQELRPQVSFPARTVPTR
ncbi:PrsW family intramembrane metalloprotease [Nocardioides sp.]|uniref:PrsW family intramembrane metalloprotease n=1 Tax=Nocardioides sp. TaxID=35761 RepID=UPI003D0BFBB5